MSLRSTCPLLGAIVLVFTACSTSPGMPGSPSTLQAPQRSAASNPVTAPFAKVPPPTKSYGVGLSIAAGITGGNGWDYQYCFNKGSDCGGIVQHKTSAKHAVSHVLPEPSNGVTFNVATSDDSTLGQSAYSIDVKAKGSPNTPPGPAAAVNPVDASWTDNLHIISRTLPKGTQVTISVALSVAPSITNVDCATSANATIDYFGEGVDSLGQTMEVGGSCAGSNGQFIYYLDGGNGPQGTTDTGVITGSVGDTIGIYGSGSFAGGVCNSACTQKYVSNIAGTVTWKITGISPAGASYKTDSGRTYT